MLMRPSLPTPTEEQIVICDHVRNATSNLMVNAYAGTGKTTTLQMMVAASKKQPTLCLAFNKRIAVEMEKRFPPSTTVRTFNGLGHRAWAAACGGKLVLDDKKMYNLLKEETKDLKGEDRASVRDAFLDILRACGLAKGLGYVPEGKFPTAKRLCSKENFHDSLEEKPSPLIAELIDSLLLKSIKTAFDRGIDYDDQVYMPAVFGAPFPRFPFVVVDEGQDLNPANHEMLGRLVRDRFGLVGDRWQSIYAFRGAVPQGMDRLKERFACEEKGLTVSFRCPRAVVEYVQPLVPDIRWLNEGGRVEGLSRLDLDSIPEFASVLCRNNAPLFRLAFALLARKRSVSVAGSEIGPRLVRLLQKIGDAKDNQEALISKIDAWKEEKLQKANAPRSVEDMAACMKIFASFGANLDQAVAYCEMLFKQQGTIKLSTGHKAKGLEWDVVYHLDPWLIRDDDEQDLNLHYVISTRAKQELFEIDSENIEWKA